MKKSKKMSSTKVNLETRISARVPNSLYIAIRLISSSQSMTIEEKIAELCKNEVAYVSKQKWFIDLIEKGGADDIMPLMELLEKRKKIIDSSNYEIEPGQVEFDSNYMFGNEIERK